MKVINTLVLFIAFYITAAEFHSINGKILYSWSQVIPENKLSIRVITDNNTCPILNIDNKNIKMLNRTPYSNNNKNNETVCETITQIDVKKISVENINIPILPKKIRKIAFIGDTGCRINTLFQQKCNFIDSWPLKKNLNSIGLHKPDLIIHLGDYHYRKTKCRNEKKCGNIYGYNKETWYADWFQPGKDILLQSTFLFIRGNHENCSRAYEGWYRYLDPYPFLHEKCEDIISSWSLDVGPMKFFIFDSSSGDDIFMNQSMIDAFEKEFNKLLIQNDSKKPTWFLTHKTLWSSPRKEFLNSKSYGNFTQIKAFADKFPKNITTIVSGHFHIAQVLFMSDVPNQIIIGNGGALLHAQNQQPTYKNINFSYPSGKNYLAHKIKSFFGFGFAILNLDKQEFTFYNQDNQRIYSIKLNKNFELQIKSGQK